MDIMSPSSARFAIESTSGAEELPARACFAIHRNGYIYIIPGFCKARRWMALTPSQKCYLYCGMIHLWNYASWCIEVASLEGERAAIIKAMQSCTFEERASHPPKYSSIP